MTQNDALAILKTGKNAFVTGPAGSGKTHVVNAYIAYLREHGVPIGITASTGIAATHGGGVTIHSWAGIGVRDALSDDEIEEIAGKAYVRNKIMDAEALFIDEISMLHHYRLDMVDRVLRRIKKKDAPFGGIQVVLCGDFFQLPPVSRYGEPESRFAYRSEAWKQGNFAICYLEGNHRQKNDALIGILGEMREGEVSEGSRELLSSRHMIPDGEPTVTTDGAPASEPTRLYTHNIDVDAINERELSKVQESECIYEMNARGKKPLVEALKKSCLAPESLRLRKGARVMCVKNNFDKGYVNGTLGIVISCGVGVDPVIRTGASPEYPDGRTIAIEPATWQIEDDGKVLAEISQYPLRLAWAITVHKSQGMSLDSVEVDLSKTFEPGMGYVALSRATSLKGLSILGFNEGAFRVHPDVLEYDRHLRELSARAEQVLLYSDADEMRKSHEEFLARVAPMHAMGSKKKKGNRAKKESTYEKTFQLVKKQKPLREIAREREMTPDTIIAHIEKLVEQGPEQGGCGMPDIAYLKYEIPSSHMKKIEQALQEVSESDDSGKPPLLNQVKSKVGPSVSFKDIRLARVVLGYMNASN